MLMYNIAATLSSLSPASAWARTSRVVAAVVSTRRWAPGVSPLRAQFLSDDGDRMPLYSP